MVTDWVWSVVSGGSLGSDTLQVATFAQGPNKARSSTDGVGIWGSHDLSGLWLFFVSPCFFLLESLASPRSRSSALPACQPRGGQGSGVSLNTGMLGSHTQPDSRMKQACLCSRQDTPSWF